MWKSGGGDFEESKGPGRGGYKGGGRGGERGGRGGGESSGRYACDMGQGEGKGGGVVLFYDCYTDQRLK